MIYLVIAGDPPRVEAYGVLDDDDNATPPDYYDMKIPDDVWNSNGSDAHVVDGKIVLGAAPEKLFELLRINRNKKFELYDGMIMQANRELRDQPEARSAAILEWRKAWDDYANALAALPDQPGAPWDGGFEKTPWPTPPGSLKTFLAR